VKHGQVISQSVASRSIKALEVRVSHFFTPRINVIDQMRPQQALLKKNWVCIIDAERHDHNISPELFDDKVSCVDANGVLTDTFRYQFRDEKKLKALSSLLD
jgi:hypothetical protein